MCNAVSLVWGSLRLALIRLAPINIIVFLTQVGFQISPLVVVSLALMQQVTRGSVEASEVYALYLKVKKVDLGMQI